MSINIYPSTHEIRKWNDEIKPAVKTADWLTSLLVEADILPYDFYGSRVAPMVVGIGFPERQKQKKDEDLRGYLKGAVELEYLSQPPSNSFNPHYQLKNTVRKHLEDTVPGKKKPKISLFPGYVFPDVAGGTLLLDNTLSDGECTPETLRPATEALSKIYDIENIAVGTEMLTMNEFGFTPEFPIPSTIREALTPTREGTFDLSVGRFRTAAATIRRFNEQIQQ